MGVMKRVWSGPRRRHARQTALLKAKGSTPGLGVVQDTGVAPVTGTAKACDFCPQPVLSP